MTAVLSAKLDFISATHGKDFIQSAKSQSSDFILLDIA